MMNKILLPIIFILLSLLLAVQVLADQSVYGNLYVQDKIYGDNITARTGHYFIGSGKYLTDIALGQYILKVGDTWLGNMDVNDYILTNVGELVMSGTITSQDIIPDTTELYSLGNSSHWWDVAYIKTLYAESINASEINSTDVNSDNVNVDENLTISEFIITEESDDLVIILT